MSIFETLLVSLEALFANKLRSMLTMLGVIIGIAAVIAMMALGEGAQRSVEARLASMGTNVLSVRPGQTTGPRGVRTQAPLTMDDAMALRDGGELVGLVSPELESRQQVESQGRNASLSVTGVWNTYFEVQNFKLAAGRLINDSDEDARRRVVVVGALAGQELGIPSSRLLGETIRVKGTSFEVVGVLAERGGAGFSNPDEGIFVPLSTARYRIVGTDNIRNISVQTVSAEAKPQAMHEIDRILRREHRLRPGADADFSIRDNATLVETMQETTQTFSFLLAGIAAISLLVGGIGIMNIMLVSVTERTREIGLRKALGAQRSDILLQFLTESLVLCVLGGAVGIGVGVGGSMMLEHFAGWETFVAPESILLAFGFSAVVGIFFGLWPARRASGLAPIEALRFE